ncbi:hypothetical protein PENTCL1PPCAC_19858, partial [Pristionchus entomophagus]
ALVPESDKDFAAQGMIPEYPQKMVLLVHGGPESRDWYRFSPTNGLLTSRGYAMMQVNFRGSVGFGKRLTNEGNGEWSRKVHKEGRTVVREDNREKVARKRITAEFEETEHRSAHLPLCARAGHVDARTSASRGSSRNME